jgi:uncharacterized membrane protein
MSKENINISKENINSNGVSLYGNYIPYSKPEKKEKINISLGQKAAEKIAAFVGSWKFIIGQSVILSIWVILNIIMVSYAWDPYPYILMNLFLSLQAAYTAPLILMSENRKAEQDRQVIYQGWMIDKKISKNINEMEFEIEEKLSLNEEKLDKILEEIRERKNGK